VSRFVITPTGNWLEKSLAHCSFRFLIASPYVSSYLPAVVARLSPAVATTLLTRTDLRDFALGSSDIDALCDIARRGGKILGLAGLHAKAYVIDDKCALVTSANATHGGMKRNWECGVSIEDPKEIEEVATLVLDGFGSRQTLQSWAVDEIELLREPVRTLREQLPPVKKFPKLEELKLPVIKLNRKAQAAFLSGFSGWTELALEGVLSQEHDAFTLDALLTACKPLVATRFPRNRHVREQIRKQLQRLRDLGLVEFLGGGNYCRTVHA
jgi:phosphatidylserine/phosphatidylglycerophosphate/cardiolipin synthase-like enzyme